MSRDLRMREGSSIAATKASAVNWPTPGIVISRLQAAEALVMRLMSVSIAATAVITAVRAAIRPRMAMQKTQQYPGWPQRLFDEGSSERARQPDSEHDREASDLIFRRHPLAHQFLARDDERAHGVGRQKLHVHGLEETGAGRNAPDLAHRCDRSCGWRAT